MKTQDLEAYLSSFPNYEINLNEKAYADFSLCRIVSLLERMGRPQDAYPIVHVAGSKGKGSTCVMVAHILRAAGYAVGLYTSPHLYQLNERIRLLRTETRQQTPPVTAEPALYDDAITAQELGTLVRTLKPVLEASRFHPDQGYLTYFELLTALGLEYFRTQHAGVVVLETGLGGRYDATNSVDADCLAITSISLEHTALLGTSLPAIALEKAAIIKHPDQRVVLAPQTPEVMAVLLDHCAQLQIDPVVVRQPLGAPVITAKQARPAQVFSVQSSQGRYDNLCLPLLGAHQRTNAAVAIELAEQLKALSFDVQPQAIRQGLADVFWPIRFEVRSHAPAMVLDAAHNAYSLSLLGDLIRELYPQRRVYALAGFSKDKDIPGMCAALSRFADVLVLTQSQHPRACPSAQLDVLAAGSRTAFKVIPDVEEALGYVLGQARLEDVIVVTGSIFTVAEVRQHMVLKNA